MSFLSKLFRKGRSQTTLRGDTDDSEDEAPGWVWAGPTPKLLSSSWAKSRNGAASANIQCLTLAISSNGAASAFVRRMVS